LAKPKHATFNKLGMLYDMLMIINYQMIFIKKYVNSLFIYKKTFGFFIKVGWCFGKAKTCNVQQVGWALKYVKDERFSNNIYEEICDIALQQDFNVYKYIKKNKYNYEEFKYVLK
jgi:hypothetical protein